MCLREHFVLVHWVFPWLPSLMGYWAFDLLVVGHLIALSEWLSGLETKAGT